MERTTATSEPTTSSTPSRRRASSPTAWRAIPHEASPESTMTLAPRSDSAETAWANASRSTPSSVDWTLSSSVAMVRPITSGATGWRMRSAAGRRRWASSAWTASCSAVKPS